MSLDLDPSLFYTDEGVHNAYELARECANLAQKAFNDVRACANTANPFLPYLRKSALKSLLCLQQSACDAEFVIETMYDQFAACSEIVKIGEVAELSAHAAALALAKWILNEASFSADLGLGYKLYRADWRALRKNWPKVVSHFTTFSELNLKELNILLTNEAFRVARSRRLAWDGVSVEPATQTVIIGEERYHVEHRNAFRLFVILFQAMERGEGPQSSSKLKTALQLHGDARPDRLFRHLPEPVRRHISRREGRGGGFFLDLTTSQPIA